MPLTQPELFTHVHAIVRLKDVSHFGGYHKAFGHFLRRARAQQLVKSWNV